MFQRILVPVDLSEKSVAAVDVAYDLATESGAETVEHIAFEEMKEFYDRLEKSARNGLQELSEKFAAAGLQIDQAVVYGHRTKEIVEFAVENRAELVIMASHRIDPDRPGHDWSSISYAVAILAPCPVLLVK
jgi:nucleotide-binding universal stress UspA family protein